jgi:hypothetical protein
LDSNKNLPALSELEKSKALSHFSIIHRLLPKYNRLNAQKIYDSRGSKVDHQRNNLKNNSPRNDLSHFNKIKYPAGGD